MDKNSDSSSMSSDSEEEHEKGVAAQMTCPGPSRYCVEMQKR